MGAGGFLLLFALLGAARSAEASSEGCPDIVQRSRHFAKVHNGTCYLFVDQEKHWKDARSDCWNMGGEMVTIQDKDTMTFIAATLNSRPLRWKKEGVWLGARYSGGAWRWTSGVRIRYSNWSPGEPSKLLGIFSVEDCALMRRDDNWRWHDYVCGSQHFYNYNYICQFPFNPHGQQEPHYASHSLDNGNMTILTIILSTGGIILLILLVIFLIVRKRYNYKKGTGQPAVHFDNRNYSNNITRDPLPPPPAPHSSHRPTSGLYLTPVEVGAVPYYEEVQKPNGAAAFPAKGSLTSTPAGSSEMLLGACGGASPFDLDSVTNDSTPLVSRQSEAGAFLGQSEESLHSMSGSLTMKTSNVHNDYVDMNGSPVVSSRSNHGPEPADKPKEEAEGVSKSGDGESGKDGERKTDAGEGKPSPDPDYSNLTTSQERSENLYLRLM